MVTVPISDGFDHPIGTALERRQVEDGLPGKWVNSNPYARRYTNDSTGNEAYHTGVDLNLNFPHWNADKDAPVYACANGWIIHSVRMNVWGNVIVIQHNTDNGPVFSRYSHLATMAEGGAIVRRGQQIGTVGQDERGGAHHLHFDISTTEAMKGHPGDWPGLDKARIERDYVDPLTYIAARRPEPIPVHAIIPPDATLDEFVEACILARERALGFVGFVEWRNLLLAFNTETAIVGDTAVQIIPYPDNIGPVEKKQVKGIVTRGVNVRAVPTSKDNQPLTGSPLAIGTEVIVLDEHESGYLKIEWKDHEQGFAYVWGVNVDVNEEE